MVVSPKDGPIWDPAPHTLAKHQIIRKYLGGWYPKLTRGNWGRRRVIFLDGFAGPGLYHDGSEGSPLIALRGLLDRDDRKAITDRAEVVFIFNEHSRRRYDILQEELAALEEEYGGWGPNVKVIHSRMKFDKLLDEIDEGLDGKQMAPMFAFVDPFGYADVSMDKLKRLLAHNACELFIYFDFNSVQRFATSGVVDEALKRLYGCDDFKDAPPKGDPERPVYLLQLYEEKLRDVAGFDYVQAFRMVNEQGKTNNFMIFASRHLDGLDLMKKAMWSVDPLGEYKFEDRMAGQDILVGMEHLEPLKAALRQEFGGRTVSLAEVDRYVLTQTPYHRGHLKQKTLYPMRRDGHVTTHPASKGIPDGCQLTFEPI